MAMIKEETKKFLSFLIEVFKPYKYKLISVFTLVMLYSVCVVYFPKLIGRLVKLFESFSVDTNVHVSLNFYNQLITLTIIIIVAYVLKLAINYMMYPVSEQITFNIRKRISEKMLSMDTEFLDSHNSGDIMERMNHDTLNIRNLVGVHISSLLAKLFLVLFSLILMLITNVTLTIIYFGIMIVFVIICYIINRITIDGFIQLQSNIGRMLALVGDTLLNKNIFNTFNSSKYNKTRFDKVNSDDRKVYKKSTFYTLSAIPISLLISNIGYILIYIQAAYLLMNNRIEINILLTFVLYGQILISQIRYFAKSLHLLELSYSSFVRIYQLLSVPNHEDENCELLSLDNIKGDIEFRNVSFGYNDEKLLNNVNFKIDAGSTTVIRAKASTGKTTLIKLLMKFYTVDDGEILLDGININDIKQDNIRDNCSIISPENQIFTDSVYENLTYVLDNPSLDAVKRAAKTIGSHEYIMKLSNGYDTIISDEKNNISQGERQLILLTRAYLDDSKIIILDNPTRNIDLITRMDVKKALGKLINNKTCIILKDDENIRDLTIEESRGIE